VSTSLADPEPRAVGEILVAEHEPAVAELIRRYLAKEGLRVRCARTPEDTEAALAGLTGVAAVVLDLTMPGLDARAIRKLIRGGQPASRRGRPQPALAGAAPGAPVICLTAGGAAHAVQGLRPRDIGVGQDSCVTRPFGPRTLVSRVRAAARTVREPADAAHAAGGLRLDPGRRRATLNGTEVTLTGTEFDVLSCLVRSAGRTVPRHRLRQAVWGESGGSRGRTVDVYVAQLRAKLGPGHGIRTVRGIGYVMDPGP
jgi:DNA-binding response OmpR family regulator